MAILITGVNGMIGYPLALELSKEGRQIVGVDIKIPNDAKQQNVEFLEADITRVDLVNDIIASRNIDCIIHAGGISGPMLHKHDPYKVFDINTAGTLNVIEAARKHGTKRLVFLSTFVAYGEQKDISLVDEARKQTGDNFYAASKIASENILRSYRANCELETISLRLGAVYGPRRTTDCLLHKMIRHSINRVVLDLPYGKDWARPYVFIDDVVEAVRLAVDAPNSMLNCDSYNISGGIWPTIDEIRGIIADVSGFRSITLQNGRTPNDYLIGPLSIEAASRDLRYVPSYDLKRGIKVYYGWLQKHQF